MSKRTLEGIISEVTDKEIQRLGKKLSMHNHTPEAAIKIEEKILEALMNELDVADGKTDNKISRATLLKKLDQLEKLPQQKGWHVDYKGIKRLAESLESEFSVKRLIDFLKPNFEQKIEQFNLKNKESAQNIPGGVEQPQTQLNILFSAIGEADIDPPKPVTPKKTTGNKGRGEVG